MPGNGIIETILIQFSEKRFRTLFTSGWIFAEEIMKTHRIMALLCAGIIALSPVAENVSCVYAAEAQEAELSEEGRNRKWRYCN